MTQTYVALLRGINVGGRNKLPMAELKSLVQDLGGCSVRTYIQSGNVVFEADADLGSAVSEGIAERHGLKVPVVLRTAEEVASVVASNPFLVEDPRLDAKTLHVAFLADEPTAEQAASLDPERSPPDAFRVVGKTVYLHYPNGLARSKLTNAYLDSKLKTVSTVRNWNTCLKLVEMAAQ